MIIGIQNAWNVSAIPMWSGRPFLHKAYLFLEL